MHDENQKEMSLDRGWEYFSRETRGTIFYAADEAARARRCNYISTEHLLIGLLRDEEGVIGRLLKNKGLSLAEMIEELHRLMGPIGNDIYKPIQLTGNAKGVIQQAINEAHNAGRTTIEADDLLLGLLQYQGLANRFLTKKGIDVDYVRQALADQ